MDIPAANKKLAETEFFFMLMQKHFDRYEFEYFLSAFLSALRSCTEHNRLQSADPRFKDWYEGMKASYFLDASLQRLAELRNREVHQKGTESSQRAGMSFPEGITTTSLVLEMDFRSGPPVGRYKSAEMEEFAEHPVEYKWVWDVEGEPDVMELCGKGVEVTRAIVKSRDEMGFRE